MHGPEKPGDIPKTRKLAALKQYGFLNGLSPGFSPAERFFRQWPRERGYEGWYAELLAIAQVDVALILFLRKLYFLSGKETVALIT
jgi:hypothetical protein